MIALAWRNLWRQPRRTLLTLSAVAFAALIMVFLLSLQEGVYATMKDNSLGLFDGYAQVQRPGYLDDPGIRESFPHADELARSLRSISGIGAVAARAQTYALLSKDSRSLAAMLVGVEPDAEREVSRIPATVKAGRYPAGDDRAELVLGESLARNLGAGVGDRVTLLGMGRDGSVAADVLTVAGIFSSGMKELDRQLAELPLSRFQSDFAMPDQAHLLVLSGSSLAAVNRALPEIRQSLANRDLAVRAWGELEPGLKEAIRLDASMSMLWYVALVVVVVAILLNTILMSVLERTREFGILLALGMRPSAIGRMVWLEILILLALGLSLGIAIGGGAALWFAVYGMALPGAEGIFSQWGLSSRMYPEVTLLSLFGGPAVIAAFSALAGLYPFFRLRRLEPVAAMRAA